MAAVFRDNAKWVKRMETFFEQTDVDNHSYLTIENFETWVDNIARVVQPDPALVDKLYVVVREFWGECGFKPGVKLGRDEFINKMAEFAVVENARLAKGVDPLLYKLDDIFYDAADTNRDGFLSMDEYEKVQMAVGFDAGTAKTAFAVIDKNHDGKLSRDELNESDFGFWFAVDDSKSSGMFGAKFE
jgi:hypothetical protein